MDRSLALSLFSSEDQQTILAAYDIELRVKHFLPEHIYNKLDFKVTVTSRYSSDGLYGLLTAQDKGGRWDEMWIWFYWASDTFWAEDKGREYSVSDFWKNIIRPAIEIHYDEVLFWEAAVNGSSSQV